MAAKASTQVGSADNRRSRAASSGSVAHALTPPPGPCPARRVRDVAVLAVLAVHAASPAGRAEVAAHTWVAASSSRVFQSPFVGLDSIAAVRSANSCSGMRRPSDVVKVPGSTEKARTPESGPSASGWTANGALAVLARPYACHVK